MLGSNKVHTRRWAGRLGHGTIALLLALFTIVLLVATAPAIGLTWDEPAYIVASESYFAWMEELVTRPEYALSERGIQTYWTVNHEHPPLDKIWSGLVWSVARLVLDDLTAHRLGNMLLAGALVALVYLLLAPSHGRVAGLAAVGALLTMPRFFFHAHLAALDVPAAFAVFATIFFFWRTKDRHELRWSIGLGVIWGLALATKINAVFVPFVLFLWILIWRLETSFLYGRLALMGVVGIPCSVVVWPWLYHESVERMWEYVRFVTIDHWEIGQWYLGRLHMPPPWHFTFVMVFAVLPLVLTVLYVAGIVRTIAEKRERELGVLLVIAALVPMLALAIGQSMVYDNDRLFMPSFPFLAALAGIGFDWARRGLQKVATRVMAPAWARVFALVVLIAAFIPHITSALSVYPHLLSYYSESIGGLPGAARLGLEHTYWCETYSEAFPYLNANAQSRDKIWVQNWSHDVMFYYQVHGRLRPDLYIIWPEYGWTPFAREGARGRRGTIWDADYVVLQYRQTGFNESVVEWLSDRGPEVKLVYSLEHHGVPLLEIYAREE
jgi:4-amino-4-deoxy-L-arabinose transferase-like glycosyltransferase